MESSPVEEPAAEQSSAALPAQRREPDETSDAPEAAAPLAVFQPSAPLPVAPTGSPEEPAQLAPLIPSTPPAAVSRRAQAGSRFPLWLAISVGVLSLLCVSALGIGYHYYDKATAPDRSTPAIAVQNYLQAFLGDRSNAEAATYACTDQSGLAALIVFRDQALQLVKSHGHTASFGWEIGDVAPAGNSATVDVIITEQTFAGSTETGSAPFSWELTTRRISGWRVCTAVQVS